MHTDRKSTGSQPGDCSAATTQETPQLAGCLKIKEKDFSECSEEAWYLDFGILPSRTVKEYISVGLSH